MSSFKLNILIVEDNFSFALELQMLLEELNYNVIGVVDNSAEALEMIFSKSPDLIFMDIEIIGNLSGIEIGQKISHLNIPILYISSQNNQETYEVAQQSNMIGFLVKPVEKISLRSTIQLAIAKAYSMKEGNTNIEDKPQTKNNIITDDCYYFKKKETFHKVFIKDITFIRSDDNYCETHTIDGQAFTSRITISKLEETLPKDRFMRTHRQYIVHTNHIDMIDLNDSTLKIQGTEIPVSRNKRKEIAELFKMIK